MSPWFREEKKPRKRPDWLAPAIWPRTLGLFTCRLFGVQYYFAITPETRPIADMVLGKEDPWSSLSKSQRRTDHRRADLAERGMVDIISALLCQVRDTAVNDAAVMLGQEIRDKLHPLLAAKIQSNISFSTAALSRLESGAGSRV